jgi:hypothetical protein
MGFVIIFPENLSQNKAKEKNEKKPRICNQFPALESGLLDQFSFDKN